MGKSDASDLPTVEPSMNQEASAHRSRNPDEV